jgi:hypothetical protein
MAYWRRVVPQKPSEERERNKRAYPTVRLLRQPFLLNSFPDFSVLCRATRLLQVGVPRRLTRESECVTTRLMTRDAHLSVRVPADLKQALERLAASEQRTLASYVHFVLHQHVAEQASEAGTKSRKSSR